MTSAVTCGVWGEGWGRGRVLDGGAGLVSPAKEAAFDHFHISSKFGDFCACRSLGRLTRGPCGIHYRERAACLGTAKTTHTNTHADMHLHTGARTHVCTQIHTDADTFKRAHKYTLTHAQPHTHSDATCCNGLPLLRSYCPMWANRWLQTEL